MPAPAAAVTALAVRVVAHAPSPTPLPPTGPAEANPAAPPFCRFIQPSDLPKYPLCNTPASGGGGGIVGSLVGSAVDQVADAMAKAEVQVVQMMMTWWTRVPSPTLSATDPASTVHWLQAHTWSYTLAVAVFGLLLAAGRLAWQRRGEAAREAFTGLLTLVIVTGCGVAAIDLAVKAGDAYSGWIIDQSVGEDRVGGAITKAAALTGVNVAALAPGLIIILAVFAIISALIQMALMLVRVAMLGLLAGLLPIGAAAAVTPEGRGQYRRGLSWLIAFVLYKPAAATIYAYGFKAMTGPDTLSQLSGIIMIILAVLALPALMRLVTPMVAPTTSSGGGAAAAAGFAGAMGARMVPAGRGGGSGGGTATSGMNGGGSHGAGPAGADPAAGGPGRSSPGGGGTASGGKPGGGQPPGSGAPVGAAATPAGGGGSAAAGAAAAGPAGAAVAGAIQAGQQVKNAAEGAAGQAAGEGGPDGSR